MLTLRQRGKARNWYIRGTVAFGGRVIDVQEFSSGTSEKAAAEYLKSQKEQELVEQLMFGPRATAARATVADALSSYLSKPKRPGSSDLLRVGKLNELIGDMTLGDPLAAWRRFQDEYLTGYAPAGQDRYRSVLQSAINVYNARLGLASVRIPSIPFQNERIRFLSLKDRDRLIASYAPHARPIATVLAFQGPRTQEALQLPWGAGGIDMEQGTIYFSRTKNGCPRSVQMHERVEAALRPLWESRGRPSSGHAFLNRLGRPYTDTRRLKLQGGNPLAKVHATACKRAKIEDFTVHDWRHHWASRCVMAGIDLVTIMRMGGWKSLRMLQRYAAVDVTHMKEAVLKLP